MNTMQLLDDALAINPVPFWTEKLKLSRGALHTAKTRGHLSPAIAGALAEELGKDPRDWIVIAALESEKESACKDRMIKKIRKITSLYLRKAFGRRRVTTSPLMTMDGIPQASY